MLLLDLLLLRFAGVLVRQLLVLLVLLLLQLVSFHLLIRGLFVLLLLILLVQLRFACVWSVPCKGRKVVRMDSCDRLSRVVLRAPLISSAIGWGVRRSCFFGRYGATVIKITGSGCRCDSWLAHVRRGALLRVGSGRLRVLGLRRDRRNMSLPRCCLIFRPWTRTDPAIATVVADVVLGVIDICV